MKQLILSFFLLLIFAGCKAPDPNPEQVTAIIVYPNPAETLVSIHVRNPTLEAYQIQVFDPSAKLIIEQKIEAGDTTHNFTINLSDHKKGKYHVVFKNAKENSTVYFLKY